MPIARATVTAFLRPSAGFQEPTGEFSKSKTQIAQVTATDDGRFAIDVTDDASYRLEAQASGLGTEIQEGVFSGEEVVLTMKRAGRFAFKVLHDESDEPCANAVLRLSRTGIVGSIFEGETDDRGRALVGDLAPGIYLVEVTPRDAERVFTIDLVLQAGEKLEHELRAKPGQTVRGIVRNSIDRAPIAGARVIHRPDRVATTDGAGRFEIRGLPSGQTRVTLDVDANGFALSSSKLDPKSTEPVEVSLAPEARVSGRLVDASAAPVPLAWVIIDEREARTDSNGAFVVRGLAANESATCFVRAVGNATLAALAPKAIAPGENDWGTIALDRPARVSGRVLTQDGKPVAGAIVTLKARGALEPMPLTPKVMDDVVFDDDTTGVEDTSVVVGVGAVGSLLQSTDFFGQPRTDAGPLRDRTARTVATGRFSTFDLPSGRYLITARGQGHAQTAPVEVEVSAGQLRDDIEIRFATGSSIQGRVLSMDGAPIAGAWIVLLDPEENNWSGRVGVNSLSGLDGGFSLEGLSARRYDLEVSFHGIAAGHAYATARISDLVPPIRDLDVQLRPLAFVEGALVDDAGRPLEQLWVRATDTEGRRESAQTDERGRFRVGVIEGRKATLTVFPATPNIPLLWDAELSDVAAGTTHVVMRASRKK